MISIENIIKKITGKGVVKNYSKTKEIWAIESDKHVYIAHKLLPKTRSPYDVDADGFRRVDGKEIDGHNWWWKIWGRFTTDILDSGQGLQVDVLIKLKIDKVKDRWKDVSYDPSNNWGIPIRNIIGIKKNKKRKIEQYLVEEYGWVSRKKALALASKGRIDNAVVVIPKYGDPYLRSYPDKESENNLSNLEIV